MKLKLLSILALGSLLTACAYDDGYYGHSNGGYYGNGGYYNNGYYGTSNPYGNRYYNNYPYRRGHDHHHHDDHRNNHDYRRDGKAERQKNPFLQQRQSSYKQPRPQQYTQRPAHPDANKYQRYNDLNRRAFPDKGKRDKRD